MKLFAAVSLTCLFSIAVMGQTSLPGAAPEIDPSSMVTALAVLTGVGLIIRSRFKGR